MLSAPRRFSVAAETRLRRSCLRVHQGISVMRIGAAFAFHAGEVRQAPATLQRLGLEWAYRIAMEPRRLFKRYFTYNSLFLYHLVRDKV